MSFLIFWKKHTQPLQHYFYIIYVIFIRPPQATIWIDCAPQPSPLKFSLVWTTQMALLFTVVLSACPSRISQSHNPLFIPTEAQRVCKWTWVMADKERLTSPPIEASQHSFKHAWKNTREHIVILRRTYTQRKSTSTNNREWKRANEKGFRLSFLDITPSFSVLPVFLCHVTL